MKDKRPWLVIAFLASLTPGCDNPQQPSLEFHAARDLLSDGKFQAADDQFAQFLQRYPKHELCSRAQFLRGKASIGIGDLESATIHFQRTITDYTGTEEAHKARFKLAILTLWQGDTAQARDQFNQLLVASPGTLVPEAGAWLRWLDASGALHEEPGDSEQVNKQPPEANQPALEVPDSKD